MSDPMESKYSLNEVACDWLTLSTFDKKQGEIMGEYFEFMGMPQAKIMQYDGRGEGGTFWGKGEQKGFVNYLFQSSGWYSNTWLSSFLDGEYGLDISKWRCSRFDIQLTLATPKGYNLKGWQWVHRNEGRRSVNHFESKQGDTVYLGSRKSQKLVRVYVKGWIRDDADKVGLQHIRVEFQLRQDIATAVIRKLEGGERLISIFNGLWDGLNGRVPRVAGYDAAMCDIVRRTFDDALPNLPTQLEYTTLATPNTLRWLKTDVDSAIRKMILSHDGYNVLVLNELIGNWLQLLQREFVEIDI